VSTYCEASGSSGPAVISCSFVGQCGFGCRSLLRAPRGFAIAFIKELGPLGKGLFLLLEALRFDPVKSDLNRC